MELLAFEAVRTAALSLADGRTRVTTAAPDQRFQIERHGYFVTDRIDHAPGRPVLNRITTLRDTWTK